MAKKFEVTILGVNSAYPIHDRHPSCQVVNYNERLFMIDCGEAAQIQLSKFKIKRGKIDHIFISHLHGDHCYGLPGLLTSYSLQSRKSKMTLHGPPGVKCFLDSVFSISGAHLSYELDIIEYDTEIENIIPIDSTFSVSTFPMKHRIPTMGFRFSEQSRDYNIKPDAIRKFELTIDEIKSIKKGNSIFRNNQEISHTELTFARGNDRSYSYCSDTIYDLELVPYIQNSTLLYHETTYLDGLETLAAERGHSTLGQAIKIAKASNIKHLIVGHYSSRYQDPSPFLLEGKPKFEGLQLGEEGRTYPVIDT